MPKITLPIVSIAVYRAFYQWQLYPDSSAVGMPIKNNNKFGLEI